MTLPFRLPKTIAEHRCPHAHNKNDAAVRFTAGGSGTVPSTTVAQAAHAVRYRRDLRRSSELLDAMSKDELLVADNAPKACPS